jgi:argininosuccinate lyase
LAFLASWRFNLSQIMSGARGGRLPQGIDQAMQRLNVSVDVDSALWREDIDGSIAHARGLEQAGVLSTAEAEVIVSGLERIALQIQRGELAWDPEREDVHMNIEARLIELVGPVGGKLHTGRSRNDQIATDLRLWSKKRTLETIDALHAFGAVLIDRAERELDVLMPAYTHLQRAQPSRLSHHLLAWQELLWRDRGRLVDARDRLDESPLGSGAVAGTGFPLERESVALALGFSRATRNSIDATGSRDFLMELSAALAILGVHLSRIGEEIVLWSSQEFGFMTLSDRFATSSSMMPQKKNPDVAELVRGRAARSIGCVVSLLALEKALPFGYGRDLQEDKRPILDAFENAISSLYALSGAVDSASFNSERMRQALFKGHLCATDLADFLVLRGLPFREAHHVVGALVREAEARGVELGQLPEESFKNAHASLEGPELGQVLDPALAVERRSVLGGPARVRVVEAIAEARERWTRF